MNCKVPLNGSVRFLNFVIKLRLEGVASGRYIVANIFILGLNMEYLSKYFDDFTRSNVWLTNSTGGLLCVGIDGKGPTHTYCNIKLIVKIKER